MKQRNLHIITFLALACLLFSFLHSEMHVLHSESEANHETHDYCNLIVSAGINNFSLTKSLNLNDQPASLTCPVIEVISDFKFDLKYSQSPPVFSKTNPNPESLFILNSVIRI